MEEHTYQGQKGERQALSRVSAEEGIENSRNKEGGGLFMSAESALYWAYSVAARPIVKLSMVNGMRGSGATKIPNELISNLGVQDMHAQAALIIGLIDLLPDPVDREYIKARFGMETSRRDLMFLVRSCLAGSGLELEKSEAVYKIVRGYFWGNVSLRAVRRGIGCRHSNAVIARRKLFDALDRVNNRALSDLGRIMEERGIVLPSRYA